MDNTLHLNAPTPAARMNAAEEYRRNKKTGKQLIGMPVISLTDGGKKGEAHDIVYSPSQGRLLYITVPQPGSLFSGGKTMLLRAEDIRNIGQDAIVVDDDTVLSLLDRDVKDVAAEAGESVLGKRLMTDDGDFLGSIADVLIDRDDRRITAYEVSGGIWGDLTRGQTDIPVDMILSIGKDVVIVPASVKNHVATPSGGLLGVASAAQEKIEEVRTNTSVAIEEREADFALGKIAGRDVTTEDGRFVVRAGETITEDHIRDAMLSDRMHALAISAGYQQAADATDSAKAKAAELAEAAKVKAARLQESAVEKQGEFLIGKTTGRPVNDDAGLTIVPEGKIVDQLDVDKARAAGKLNDLTLAVGATAVDSAKERIGGAYDSAKDRYETAQAEREANRPPAIEPAPVAPPQVVIQNPQQVIVEEGASTRVSGGEVTLR